VNDYQTVAFVLTFWLAATWLICHAMDAVSRWIKRLLMGSSRTW
jgi:hypothetical protein